MPLSFQGFGSTAIILMVIVLAVGQGIGYIKARHRHH
jgi:hypothetical protein